ncbi:MAG TPA: T9SS type A sorting domain-containing protein, partial [Candidatus Marinimicrobia bacterium]|nr:T9SS type A sorting domain-containing protein [Candidatus Neomarinimicrobiota bacterium]
QVVFGPDGYLYIGMGDGGAGGDPYGHGQNLNTLLATMLRIDVDNPDIGLNYGIPDDNPFVGTGYKEEIYAYGLRNPWRFSFDPVTEICWIADVGQNLYEEIDLLEAGGNYGWNIMEGFHCYNPPSGCDTTGLIKPVFEYNHSWGESITGGFVYRGTSVPDIYGKYIFADFEYGDVWSLEYDGENPPEVSTLGDLGPYSVTSFGVDQQDELYICSFDGAIYKFVQTNSAGEHSNLIPNKFSLYQNYPNPFNPITTMSYDLPEDSFVNITIYDILGLKVKTVVNTTQNAGHKSVIWDATDSLGKPVSAGVYLFQIQAEDFRQTKKMVLLK